MSTASHSPEQSRHGREMTYLSRMPTHLHDSHRLHPRFTESDERPRQCSAATPSQHEMSDNGFAEVQNQYTSAHEPSNTKTNVQYGAPSLRIGRTSAPPAYHDDAELAMPFPAGAHRPFSFPVVKLRFLYEQPTAKRGLKPWICTKTGAAGTA